MPELNRKLLLRDFATFRDLFPEVNGQGVDQRSRPKVVFKFALEQSNNTPNFQATTL